MGVRGHRETLTGLLFVSRGARQLKSFTQTPTAMFAEQNNMLPFAPVILVSAGKSQVDTRAPLTVMRHRCRVCCEPVSSGSQPLYDESFLWSPALAHIVTPPTPSALLCSSCRGPIEEVFSIACRRIAACAVSPLHPSRGVDRPTQDINVSVQIVAQRIAFLRGLPVVDVCRPPTPKGPARSMSGLLINCLWCPRLLDMDCRSLRVAHKKPARGNGPGRVFYIHDECWEEACQTVHIERLAQCVDSQALWLPLLPEVCRLVALFVVQLSAVGLGAAAGRQCPIWASGGN